MLCQQCNANLAEGANFCHICGAKQEKKSICSACGNALIAGAKFCFNCGAAVGGACATTNSFSETTQTSVNPFAANATAGVPANPFAANKPSSEPFFKKWIAEHRDDAERLEIEWISQFKGEYAVAILKDKKLAIFHSSADDIGSLAYISPYDFLQFSAVRQGCDKVLGDNCFGNGLKYGVFVESSCSPTDDFTDMIESFTGQTRKHIQRGNCQNDFVLAVVFDYNGNILMCRQSAKFIAEDAFICVLNNEHYAMLDIDEYESSETERYSIYNYDGTSFVSQAHLQRQFLNCAIESYDYEPQYGYLCFSLVPYSRNGVDNKTCVYDYLKNKLYLADNNTCYTLVRSEIWQNNARPSDIQSEVPDEACYIMCQNGYTDDGYIPTIIDRYGNVVLKLDYRVCEIAMLEAAKHIFVALNGVQQDEEVTCCYSISKFYGSYKCEKAIRTTDTFSIDKLVEIPSGVFAACNGGGKLSLLNTELQTVHQVPHDGYSSDGMGYYVLNNEIYCLSGAKDNLGGTCQVVANINTGESFKLGANRKLVIKAEGEPAQDGGRGYHSEYNDDFRYSFGCITAYDEPYFLVGDSGKLNSYYIREGGCGLVDKHGRWIIPYSDDILFITQRDYLPANTFYVCCFDYIRKVYDANGTLIAQGRFDDDGKVNELRDNYEGCKLR